MRRLGLARGSFLGRAVGAKRRHILLQFLLESVVISLFGGLIGLLIGAGIIFAARRCAR